MLVDADRLAGRVPRSTSRSWPSPCGRPCATSPSRATPRRPAGSTGSARSWRRSRSAACRSGSSAGEEKRVAGPGRVGRDRRRRRRADRRSRSSWPGARTRSCRSSLFRSRAFATINLATFFIYGALYVTFSYQGLVLQGVLGYTALAAGAVGLPSGLCCPCSRRGSGRSPADRGPPVPRRRAAAHGRADCCGGARLPADSAPWLAHVADPVDAHPADRASSSTSCRPSCCSGSASRASSRR